MFFSLLNKMILKPSKQNINKHHSGQRIYSKILEKKEMQKPHKLVNRRSLSLAGSVSSASNQQPSFPPWEGLLAWCLMLCGHHLEILNIFTLDLGFCKWTRRGHLEHARWLPGDPASSHLPAPCYFPQMGSSPPCWGQRSACVAGEGPRFSVALWRPGPLWGVETGGPAPAPGGPGRGQAGWSSLGCLPPCCFWGLLGRPLLPTCSQAPGVSRCEAFSPLEVTHQPWVAGLGYEKGRLVFPDAGWLGPCIYIVSRATPVM